MYCLLQILPSMLSVKPPEPGHVYTPVSGIEFRCLAFGPLNFITLLWLLIFSQMQISNGESL